MRDELNRLAERLAAYHFHFAKEAELQTGLALALEECGVFFSREHVLDAHNRVDFLTAEGIGIEVKVDGSALDVARQLMRYAAFPEVRALLLVTTRARHRDIPLERQADGLWAFRVPVAGMLLEGAL